MQRIFIVILMLVFIQADILLAQSPPPPSVYKVEIITYNSGIILAKELNDNGVVVGYIRTGNGNIQSFRWNGQLNATNRVSVLNSLAPQYLFATINNSGLSVGTKIPAEVNRNRLVTWDGINVSVFRGVEQFENNVRDKDQVIISVTEGLIVGNVNVFAYARSDARVEAPRIFVGYNDNAELLPIYSRQMNLSFVEYANTQATKAIVRNGKYYVFGVSRFATTDVHNTENIPTVWFKAKTTGVWQKDNTEWTIKTFGVENQNTKLTGADKLQENGDLYACGFTTSGSNRGGVLFKLSSPWSRKELVSLRNNDLVEVLDMRYVEEKSRTFAVGTSGNKATRWMFTNDNNHTVHDLNSLIERNAETKDLILTRANCINKKGQILCEGLLNGVSVSVVLSFK